MRKSMLFITLTVTLALAFITLVSCSQISVVPLSKHDKPQRDEGFYYALPKTMVRVEVWIDKIETIRGPYAEYAERLLGLDVPKLNTVSYRLAGVGLSSFHEADPDHYYFARLPKKQADGLELSLSRDGILQSARLKDDEKSKGPDISGISKSDLRFDEGFIDVAVPNIIERVDTFMRRISIDTTTFEEIFFRKTFIEKTTEQKAREAADFILKLEDHRLSLITGYHEVNYSAEVMQFMNDELRHLQEEYLALFKGKTIVSTDHFSYIFIPEPENEGKTLTLFKFDPQRGILEKEYPAGEAVQIAFRKANNTFQMAMHHQARDQGKRKYKGFHYRIPEKVSIRIRMRNETLAESQFFVSQLGVLTFLPHEGVSEIQLYPETGSVKYLKLD